MPSEFDPYFEWLGIPSKHQPPDHYRLLNLDRLEDDVSLIAAAAQRVTSRLRDIDSGDHDAMVRRMLKEVMAAGSCLLDEEDKAAYDEQLQADGPTKRKTRSDDEDEFKLAPVQDEPKVRQVTQPSSDSQAAFVDDSFGDSPLGNLSPAGSPTRASSTSARRNTRSKQDPMVLTLLLVLLLAICGVAFYVIIIAPPGSSDATVAEQTVPQSKPIPDQSQPSAKLRPKTSPKRKSNVRATPKRTGSGPKLDPIDAVVAMPRVKPLPFAVEPDEENLEPIDNPAVDDAAPEDREAAEALWEKGQKAARSGDVPVAIESLEKYILQQISTEHHAEAQQLLIEVRAAIPDKRLIERIFQSLSDEQLDDLFSNRLRIRTNVQFTNPVLDDLFHKTLRDQVPAEQRRRAGGDNEALPNDPLPN